MRVAATLLLTFVFLFTTAGASGSEVSDNLHIPDRSTSVLGELVESVQEDALTRSVLFSSLQVEPSTAPGQAVVEPAGSERLDLTKQTLKLYKLNLAFLI